MSIELVAGDIKQLNVQLVPVSPPFDPWIYDINGDGYVDGSEKVKAVEDYYAEIITEDQLNQVLALPEPPVPECVPISEKLQAIKDYNAGKITEEELNAILDMPTCPS